MSYYKGEAISAPTAGQRWLLDIACCLVFIIYASSIVVFPVCLLEMINDLKMDFTDGGTLELVRSFVLLIILFISGQVAGRIGKPMFLSLGGWLAVIGLVTFSFSMNYTMALISIMLIGLGSGLLEALVNPLIQGHSS